MKRLLIVASVAILAAGCQKTFVQDEVQTPIGFSTEVGKQTRAIVQGTDYPTDQPFAVYAYGHQDETNKTNTIMDNVEIFYDDDTDDKWRASDGITYYWPNDPRTKINFYAYSPVLSSVSNQTGLKNHQVMNGTFSHTEEEGLKIQGYEHKNMYVDFMVATPVTGATYSNSNANNTNGCVALSFSHRMTQLKFKVKTSQTYNSINFTLNSITLKNIKNTANITNGVFTNDANGSGSYVIFPAKSEDDANGAPGLTSAQQASLIVDATENEDTEIIPVTMIPQSFDQNQSFTVEYTVSGTGVATETVTKTFKFADATPAQNEQSAPAWAGNKCITYTLTIGLNEITFSPTVADWDPTTGSYDINDNN